MLAYTILSNPVHRDQYDRRAPVEIDLPNEQKEDVAKLLDPLDKVQASRAREFGKVAGETLVTMPAFYAAMGMTTYLKCLITSDPLYCKAFWKGLADPAGHLSFGVFAVGAHYGTKTITKVLGGGMKAQALAGFGGLALGSFASTVVSDVYHLPEWKEYGHLKEIKDPVEREKKKKELIQSMWNKTGGSTGWWQEKAPDIAALIGSAALSNAVAPTLKKGLDQGTRKLVETLTPKIAMNPEEASLPYRLRCGAAQTLRKLILGEGATGISRTAHNQLGGLGQLLVFMGAQKLLTPAADWLWDASALNPMLNSSRKKLMAKPDEETLKRNATLWEQYRSRNLKPVAELMDIHAQDVAEFDKKVGKPNLYYAWLIDGAPDQGDSWDNLRKAYYSENTKPADIKKETHQYLQAFFSGVDPKDALQDSKDIHGIPIPWRMSAKVVPFYVKNDLGYDSRDKSDAEILQELKKNQFDYQQAKNRAFADFEEKVVPFRDKKIHFYENAQRSKLLEALTQKNKNGILESIQTEINELSQVKDKTQDPKVKALIDEKISQIKQEQEAAQGSVNYFSAPQGQGQLPDFNLNAMIQGLDPDHQEDWVKAVNIYKGLIIQ